MTRLNRANKHRAKGTETSEETANEEGRILVNPIPVFIHFYPELLTSLQQCYKRHRFLSCVGMEGLFAFCMSTGNEGRSWEGARCISVMRVAPKSA